MFRGLASMTARRREISVQAFDPLSATLGLWPGTDMVHAQLGPHPQKSILQEFAVGRATPEAAAFVEVHLSRCVECLRSLDEMSLD